MAGWMTWAGGCAAPSGPAAPATAAMPAPPPAPSQSADDQHYILATELEGVIEVVKVHLIHPSGGFLKLQIDVKNKTDAPRRFHYRIEWFDADGERLPLSDGALQAWMLLPRELSSIAVTAPGHAAADFEIAFVP
jgi:uncharacterized protein YcfL